MPGSQGSSFIPKQPARGKVQKRGVRKIYIFAYVSFVLFFGVLVASGGTFFYKLTEEKRLETKKQELVDQRSDFKESDLARIKVLDSRLKAANTLLDQHVSTVKLINEIERATVDKVAFAGLNLDRTTSPIVTVTLDAMTDSFNAVLFQREVLAANPLLSGTSFESVTATVPTVDPALGVADAIEISFSLTKGFSPGELKYTPVTNNQSAPAAVESLPVIDEEADLNDDSLVTDPVIE